MRSTIIKNFGLAALFLSLVATAGCGCSGVDEIDAGDPKTIFMGDTVTCSLSETDCGESCTILVGKSPEYVISGREENIEFTVTGPVADDAEIVCHCGDGPLQLITSKCTVTSGTVDIPSEDEKTVTAPESGDDDVITPTTPSAPEQAPEEAPAPEASPAPETPPSPSAPEAELNVVKVTDSNSKFITYKVTFRHNGQVAYLWGNMLNRTVADASLSASDQCKLQGGRYLATGPDGSNLNSGSPNALKWGYALEGVLCDNANGDANDDCKSPTSTAWLDTSTKDGSRFNDPMLKKDLYGYQGAYAPYNVALPPEEAAIIPDHHIDETEKNPECRMDLVKDGSAVTTGEFFTRSYAQYGHLYLVVVGHDDSIQVVSKSVSAPDVSLGSGSFTAVANKAAVQLMLSYGYGTGAQVTGCVEGSLSRVGSYVGECPINAITQTIKATVFGIGENNKKQATYTVELGSPTVTLKLFGPGPLENEVKDFKLQYEAVRDAVIKDNGSVVRTLADVSWFKKTYFSGFESGNGHQDQASPSAYKGRKDARQDPAHKEWWFGVEDFDGNQYRVAYVTPGFPKEFTFTAGNDRDMDILEKDGKCDKGSIRLSHAFQWSGTNVKSLSVTGQYGQNVWADASSDLPDDKYGADSGTLILYRDMGWVEGKWKSGINFTVNVTYQDGSQETRDEVLTGWSCQ